MKNGLHFELNEFNIGVKMNQAFTLVLPIPKQFENPFKLWSSPQWKQSKEFFMRSYGLAT